MLIGSKTRRIREKNVRIRIRVDLSSATPDLSVSSSSVITRPTRTYLCGT